jgi:hypothetical protein
MDNLENTTPTPSHNQFIIQVFKFITAISMGVVPPGQSIIIKKHIEMLIDPAYKDTSCDCLHTGAHSSFIYIISNVLDFINENKLDTETDSKQLVHSPKLKQIGCDTLYHIMYSGIDERQLAPRPKNWFQRLFNI